MRLEYNGVLIRDVQTEQFDEHVEYDDSGTDKAACTFTVKVKGRITAIPEYSPGGDTYEWRAFTEATEGTVKLGEQNKRGVKNFDTSPPGDMVSNTGTGFLNQRMRDMLARLSVPRKDFVFYNENSYTNLPSLILAVSGTPDGNFQAQESANVFPAAGLKRSVCLDCNNGPKPIDVRVIQFFGVHAAEIEFSIVVCRTMCMHDDIPPTSDSDPQPVEARNTLVKPKDRFILSNRWCSEDSLSRDLVWTTTIQGTLRVRDSRFWPHAFRYLCIPGLRDGYRRAGMHFATDPTGLVLKYRIEDRREHSAPPPPAIDWDVDHTELAEDSFGMQTSHITIHLKGRPGVSKADLMFAITQVWEARIRDVSLSWQPVQGVKANTGLIKYLAIMDDPGKPDLALSAVVQHVVNGAAADVFTANVAAMLKPLKPIAGWQPDHWPTPYVNDLAMNEGAGDVFRSEAVDLLSPAQLMHCYLQSPCSQWHDMPDYSDTSSIDVGTTSNEIAHWDTEAIKKESRKRVSSTTGVAETYLYSSKTVFGNTKTSTDQITNEALAFPYTKIEIENDYMVDSGIRAMPLSKMRTDSPLRGETVAFVKFHAGVAQRKFIMHAKRMNKPPIVPTPKAELNDSFYATGSSEASPVPMREIGKDLRVITEAPKRNPITNSLEYSAVVEYTYMLNRPPTNADKLRMATSPVDELDPQYALLDLSTFFDSTEQIDFTR